MFGYRKASLGNQQDFSRAEYPLHASSRPYSKTRGEIREN
jgi:hypothetical protein